MAITWLVAAALFAFWATLGYRSFAAAIGEWEYLQFGRHLPIVTLAILAGGLGLPALLFLWARRRVLRRNRPLQTAGEVAARAIRAERGLLRLLANASGLALLGAFVTLCWTLTLPTAQGNVRLIDSATTAPLEGPARLTGAVIYTRTATFRQNLLIFHRAVQFAPLAASGVSGETHYFIEISGDRLEQTGVQTATPSYTGILKRNGLPGAIVRLFEYAGFKVAKPHYVLFASRASMLIPYYAITANWLIAALLTFLLALSQRWRLRKIVHKHPHLGF